MVGLLRQLRRKIRRLRQKKITDRTKVPDEIIRAVKERKAMRLARGLEYRENPRLSVIIQSFNHVGNIDQLVAGLRRTSAEEIIVCEDGSIDGSLEEWIKHLDRPNDFLIHSNDLHEIRASDRAIALARGEIVCLIQDDDILPESGQWVDTALTLFDNYPQLGLLSGYMGLIQTQSEGSTEQILESAIKYGARSIAYRDPGTKTPFMFVQEANIGPYFIRKGVFEKVGGWDFRYSEVGEPGIGFDHELGLRMWQNGYQVGLMQVKRPNDKYSTRDGGTFLWGAETRKRNQEENRARRIEDYRQDLAAIQRAVAQANETLEERSPKAEQGKHASSQNA